MTRFYDGKKLMEIELVGINCTPIENEFFEVGGLKFDEELQAYRVNDVDYLIEQAEDWKGYSFDYADDEDEGPRFIEVNRLSYVYHVGGEDDGKLFGVYGSEIDAINAARESGLALGIIGEDGEDVIDW